MSIAEPVLECQPEIPEIVAWAETEDLPSSWESHAEIPRALSTYRRELDQEIQRARGIIALENDWDGEGSAGYSEETFDRAIAFLTTHIDALWESYGICLPIPRIGPGPSGSIDLYWKEQSWELLVNVPADRHEMATFYGDDYGVQKIRGRLATQNFNLGLAEWLMN